MSRQKTKDRSMVIADLNLNLDKLSVSISYDGGLKYDNVITCGISSTDTTQHRIFALEVSIEDECPIGPLTLSIIEVGELARSYMRTKGVELFPDKYHMFVVSALQKDVSKPGAANAKYRAVVDLPNNQTFIPGPSATNPCSLQRMPHFFFGKVLETKAPMENKRGSSAAVNTNRIIQAVMSLKRYLRASYVLKSKPMPKYAALFVYSNVEALENFVEFIAKITAENQELLGQVSGNIFFLRIILSVRFSNIKFKSRTSRKSQCERDCRMHERNFQHRTRRSLRGTASWSWKNE